MIHSQDVNIPDKNYNIFRSVKGLPFNFVLKFFTVSTIKSFMRSPSNYCTIAFYCVCCMALTLFICGAVELNPGPKTLNSLTRSIQYSP